MTGGSSRTFSRVDTQLADYSKSAYDNATRGIIPVITVFFPVANAERKSYANVANSTMTCLRARDYSEGSRVSPQIPAGTSYKPSSGELSGGAIAGIVVGVFLGVALLAGLGVWLFLRKRKQTRGKEEEEHMEVEKVPELDGNHFKELHDEDMKPEMDNGQLPELGDGQGRPVELDSSPLQKK